LQATGDRDSLAASLVSEALMVRGPQGQLIPNLITAVPTVENGMLAEDFTRVTFDLLPGVLWSDGAPFTADGCGLHAGLDSGQDCRGDNGRKRHASCQRRPKEQWRRRFTRRSIHTPLMVIPRSRSPSPSPNPTWSDGYTGAGTSVIYPKHVLDGGGQEAMDAFKSKPIGTGPYKVDEFTADDQVIYSVNENYREPTKAVLQPRGAERGWRCGLGGTSRHSDRGA
jgi:peptide/nickel transport system substrate-binding protein